MEETEKETSIREYLIDYFMQLGMFSKDAGLVVSSLVNKIGWDFQQRPIEIDKSFHRYAGLNVGVVIQKAKNVAKDWLDKNIPHAWYRPLFD